MHPSTPNCSTTGTCRLRVMNQSLPSGLRKQNTAIIEKIQQHSSNAVIKIIPQKFTTQINVAVSRNKTE
jgi:hypothetical protein